MAADRDGDKSSSLDDLSDVDSTSSNSGSGSDGEGEGEGGGNNPPEQVEWLVTSRARRATAGNRMKSMLANEEPAADDSDLELLFAEDENDAGFSEDEQDDASDVQMDSSSDDDEDKDNNAADELAGEKELERQAREKRTAERKRKAQEAIPAKFRKKVRIEQPAARPPRPKKKSERTSWLPSPTDMPTRASERQTTRNSKQQLHQKMVSDELRRRKQLERMEKKAKLLEALKKPPMTQAERLAEAAVVEKRNSKSLNRWEEAEKQREEERLRKIAALNNRKLDGPVVTFWSGIQELQEGQEKHVGNFVSMEEKAPRKKRQSVAAAAAAKEAEAAPATPTTPAEETGPKTTEAPEVKPEELGTSSLPPPPPIPPTPTPADSGQPQVPAGAGPTATPPPGLPLPLPFPSPAVAPGVAPAASVTSPAPALATPASEEAPKPATAIATTPSPLPSPAPPASAPGQMAPPPIPPPPDNKPSTPGVLAAPVLAPPAGVSPPMLGGQMPMLGVSATGAKSVLAAPNTSHTPSPLSMPPTTPSSIAPPAPPSTDAAPAAPKPTVTVPPPPLPPTTAAATQTPQTIAQPSPEKPPDMPQEAPPSAAEPSSEGKVTRSCIILQNFDEHAIKDKQVQTQILFGRKMNKLAKPAHPPLCVITNHPAKYRDPKTGLPYYNSYAYREIQRVHRGDYKWSTLLGAWVGRGDYAAAGVPEWFLDPSKAVKPAAAEPAPDDGVAELKVEEQEQQSLGEARLEPVEAEKPTTAAAEAPQATTT